MTDFSNYLENAIANHFFRNSATLAPTSVRLRLFTAVSDAEAGTGTEVTGGSYAEQVITFGAPSNGVIASTIDVVMPTATADWGTVTHAAIVDNSGNFLTAIEALAISRTVLNGDTLTFPAGNITVTVA